MRWQILSIIAVCLANIPAAVRSEADLVQQIRRDLASNPRDTVDHLNRDLMAKLMEQREYVAVDEFALAGTLAVSEDASRIEQLQKYRIRALLELGRKREALKAAKALFDVCTMRMVMEALPLLTDALTANHPSEPEFVTKFKLQVLAGAQEDPAERKKLCEQFGDNTVMKSLAAEPEPYVRLLKELKSKTDYKSLCSAANLELLSGHIGEAAELLDQAYKAAPADDIKSATEGLARKLKAQDAAIGRANQFVASIRPAE